jgi:hypothetical protein
MAVPTHHCFVFVLIYEWNKLIKSTQKKTNNAEAQMKIEVKVVVINKNEK